ncbi:NADH pyrophosphatase [Salipiger sp. CCB-MM3]|uniref:NAD(+) diphosphatase n=1 Tax=Salipiger sp. CCB-MM3 TaxID=1792508 RepID=UPI00080A991A|nr:NAD(+) diphosphatase [Salipiger sp. CCB-MM3]ANT61736.1 NADH pyrophosphatase [Salipiger sp. CCB-MM3]
MQQAEQVTFGGSGLDRAAEMRGDIPGLAAAMQRPGARGVVLWRGKPLLQGEEVAELLRLPLDHPLLAAASARPVLLGREAGEVVLAYDISGWEPDAPQGEGFVDHSVQTHPDAPEGSRFVELRTQLITLSPRDAELAATAKAILGWHEAHGFCSRCGAASEVTQAGWQRVCPACGAPHFPRTDPVVIMLITRGNSCLLGRSPGWPEGMYSCLAGFIEPGEAIEAAVRREVMEETGIEVGEVNYLSSQPWPFPASLMLGCHGAALSEEITIDPDEIEHAQWVSREDLAEAFAGNLPGLQPARRGSIANFLLRNWLADRLD